MVGKSYYQAEKGSANKPQMANTATCIGGPSAPIDPMSDVKWQRRDAISQASEFCRNNPGHDVIQVARAIMEFMENG